jgi:hypothetical protein
MNKTVIVCTAIVTLGIMLSTTSVAYIYFNCYASKTEIAKKTETRDRLTVCIDTVMTKSIQANKPIDAKTAREVCG